MNKEELIKLNYAQKIAIANVVIEMGKQRSFGLDGSELSELYNRAKEVQSLFYYESLKADYDSKVLHQASLKLSHLLSRFMPIGPIEITESFVVPVGKVKEAPVPSNKLKTPYISIQSVTSSSISLSWTSVENAAVYELQRALDPNFTQGVVMLQSDSNLSFVDTGLEPDTRYYYNLKAKNPPDFRDSNFAFINAKTSVFVPSVNIYYGWSDTNSLPTIEEIASSDFITILPGANYLLPFQEVQDWKYLWFWEPLTEPIKTDWEEPGNPLNKGQIGGSTNLFRSPKEIGEGRWFITDYKTIADAALLLKSGGEVIPDDPDHEWTTATPPVVTGNDTTNILTATHSEYQGEIVVSVNGGSYIPYTGPINVGDNDRPVGYWKFKVRENAEEYRHESSVVNSPEFHKIPEVAKYTLTVNVNGTTGATIYVNGSPIVGNSLTVDAGTVLNNIIVIKSGFTIDPPSVSSITMDSDKTLTFTATPIPVFRTLTIVVNGLSEPYKIFIDGVEQESNVLTFPDGTILDDISVQIDNYTVTPVSIPSLVMDQNRTATFTATPVKRTLTINTGGIEGVDIYIDEVLHTGPLVFDHGTVLSNISVHKAGYSFEPANIPSLTMDADKTLNFTGTVIPVYTLTIDVQGTAGYTLEIDGQVKAGTTFQYNDGTVVNNVKVTKAGWRFTPVSYPSTIMDGNKTLTFIAEEIPTYTLTFDVTGTAGYIVRINGVVQPSGVLTFPEGTVLTDISLSKAGWVFNPSMVNTLTMDSNKILEFTATEDFSSLNYLPGFTAYDPRERYARQSQGGLGAIPEISPGQYKINVHRLDFISMIRVPIGGELAYKCKGDESTLCWLNPQLPWPNEDQKDDYNISGYSGGIVGKNGFYGNGSVNRISSRQDQGGDVYYGTIEDNEWLLLRRINYNTLNIYTTDGITETLKHSMEMFIGDPLGGYDFNYLKHTIWDDGTINFPSFRYCFHEIDDTWPPYVFIDTTTNAIIASHDTLPVSEIMYSENGGTWKQYTAPINTGNINRPLGYWKFKTKAATGRLESTPVPSPENKAIPFVEGLTDLVFTSFNNIVYSSASKTYSSITVNKAGYAFASNNYLPIDGSAAIYFDNNLSNVWLGFGRVNNETYYGDFEVGVSIINSELVYTYNPSGTTIYIAPIVANTKYRLVCRNINDTRVWKIESTQTDWAVFEVLQTIQGAHNLTNLYPLLSVRENVSTIAVAPNIKYEVYEGQNIPEMTVITPEPPTSPIVDDVNDTYNWTNNTIYSNLSDYEFTLNGGTSYSQVTVKPINVGNNGYAVGQVGVRVKTATGRNHSSTLFNPTPFTKKVNEKPVPPTLIADDVLNTLSASHVLGESEILMSINNATYIPYTGIINVGNVNRPEGYWKFKIKASTGRDESSVVNSPAFTEVTAPEVTLLPGFSYIELPAGSFTQVDGISILTAPFEDVLNKELGADGAIAFRIPDNENAQFTIQLLDINNWEATLVAGGLFAATNGYIELAPFSMDTTPPFSAGTKPEGTFFVLRRDSPGGLRVESTLDGITFDLVGIMNSDVLYIRLESSFIGGKIMYLQGLNIRDI